MGMMVTQQASTNSTETSIYLDDGTLRRIAVNESIYITEETPVDEQCGVEVLFKVAKANSEAGLVSGWASVAVNADGSLPLDWQDDIIRPEVLEKAAVQFMMDYRDSGVMHEGDAKGVVVESIVFTKDKQASLGIPDGILPEGWFITVKVQDPEVFAKVKDGTFKMFSIQGNAKRIKV